METLKCMELAECVVREKMVCDAKLDINLCLHDVFNCHDHDRRNAMIDFSFGKLDAYRYLDLINDVEYCKYLDLFCKFFY